MLPISSHILALCVFFHISLSNLLQPLDPQEGAATTLSQKFQPAMDFDSDSCYHVVALDLHGNYNEGLQPHNPGGYDVCRLGVSLMHSNAYVRRRCNHFWCAYMYGYYFEKDEALADSHRHDWEHVIVWTLHDEIFFVSWSAHGNYDCKHISSSELQFQDSHVKIVYHQGGKRTHSMRLATSSDEPPENHWGRWFIAWLVEVTWMEPWSHNLVTHDWGSAHPDVGDDFASKLERFAPYDAVNNEGFDPRSDDNTWSMEHLAAGLRVPMGGDVRDAVPYNRTLKDAPTIRQDGPCRKWDPSSSDMLEPDPDDDLPPPPNPNPSDDAVPPPRLSGHLQHVLG